DVTLRRLPEGVDVLEVHADGDTSSLDLFVSHSDGLATGDFFALGQWGDSVVDSNAIAFGGLAGGEVFAASTSSAAGTFAEGTLRLDALDHDASTVSLSFEGELYLTADGSAGDAMVGVSGEALDLVFTEDAG
ncbi:MAG: hypothetical protein KC656_26555, partial [Myxococcales bacterium]|nr:hypothetical protein [Myxococcales bacterium]